MGKSSQNYPQRLLALGASHPPVNLPRTAADSEDRLEPGRMHRRYPSHAKDVPTDPRGQVTSGLFSIQKN
jgi:hypothetical protein